MHHMKRKRCCKTTWQHLHHYTTDCSHPWKVPSILSPRRVMLNSIQHQIQWEDSHTKYGPSTHCHLLPELHPPSSSTFFLSGFFFSLLLLLNELAWRGFCYQHKNLERNPSQCKNKWCKVSSYGSVKVFVPLLWCSQPPHTIMETTVMGAAVVVAVKKSTKSVIAGNKSVSSGQTSATGGLLQSGPCVPHRKSSNRET